MRILCVDAHKDACELIAAILEDCQVISAHTKAEALHLATSEKLDLFIIGDRLPDGTGLEICLFIRTFNQQTPIIFATFERMPRLQLENLGAQGLVMKGPNFFDNLCAAVSNVN